MTDDTDHCIIAQVQKGDRNAYAAIIDKYNALIFNLAFRLTGNRADADDLAQAIFVRTFESLNRFDHTRPFLPWLYSIALNTIRNHRKKSRLIAFFTSESSPASSSAAQPASNPEQRLILKEKFSRLVADLNKLPYRQREAIVLRYFDECTYPEIARLQQVTLSAVKMRVRRGMAKLLKIDG